MAILKESWQLLSTPEMTKIKDGIDPARHATIVMEPFERGFGNTLGNALRRVMLSSIAGFAVTSIKIDGVMHEYDSIKGVKEDVLDIIMNIKSISITKNTPSASVLRLSANSPGPVFAGSIKLPSGVEILNKDLIICNLGEGGKIDMQMTVESGKGYVPASQSKKEELEVGSIAVDAVFSPIKRVAYRIENSRVGQITDYDKLILEIETNGSISPKDSVGVAAKIIQEQLKVFIDFDVNDVIDVEKESDPEPELDKNLLKRIDELELSVRSYNCLKNENICYVGDLVIKTESEMLKTSNFGRKSLNELKENLKGMNLSFGMKLESWPPHNVEELSKTKSKDF